MSKARGDTAVLRTPATTTVSWLTQQGPNRGKARVTIDGRSKGTINLYSPTPSARAVTYEGLSKRPHTITVKVLGKKAPASRGRWVPVDGFTYRAGSGITQESDPAVRYNSWAGVVSTPSSGGSHRVSAAPGAKVTVEFTGRSIRWLTARGPAYGRARVVIDGRARVVDLYRRAQDLSLIHI